MAYTVDKEKALTLTACPQHVKKEEQEEEKKQANEKEDSGRNWVKRFWEELYGGTDGMFPNNMSEDCLQLNIWAPLKNDQSVYASLPVMVFIHGGMFAKGEHLYL